jgi:YYY domain-containing protein
VIREAVAWWLAVEVVGLVALPITLLLFRNLSGRGYAFAKPVGLLMGGYLFWLAMEAHLLPNRPGSIVWAFLPLIIADVFILTRYWEQFLEELQERWAFIAGVEVTFALFFFVGGHIRSYIPEAVGTEKPMDFMLLNTAARSRFYPPDDSWFAGAGVSYYYFGYVIQAMLAKISATPIGSAFNLALASTAGLAAATAFGLAYEAVNLLRRVKVSYALAAAAGAVLLVAVMGNLEGALEFAKANDKLPQSIERRADISALSEAKVSNACLLKNPLNSGCFVKYPNEQSSFWWWWRATRISPKADTITEFPFFSFLLGDLHPHVMSIPFLFTVAALALAFWRSPERLSWRTWRWRPWLFATVAVLAGALGFVNTWDLPTGLFLIGIVVLARNLTGIAGDTASHENNRRVREALQDAASFIAPLALLAIVLYLPFYLDFGSQAGGLDAVSNGATRPSQLILFWAPMLTIGLALPVVLVAGDPASRVTSRLSIVALLLGALLVLWAVVLVTNHGASALGDAITARGLNWLVTLFLAAATGVAGLALWRAVETQPRDDASSAGSQVVVRDDTQDDNPALLVPVLAMTFTALLLILGCEMLFIQDVFKSRVNTVFKLYYQAWLLLGVSGAVGAYWLLSRPKTMLPKAGSAGRDVWWGLALLLVAAALLYPLGGVFSRTEGLAKKPRSLDALYQARLQSPEDVSAVEWLKTHADRGEVIVESTSNDYSPGARISAWSGVPTVLGWGGHEQQWGRNLGEVAQRQKDVDAIYGAPTLADALPLLRKYHVTYVIVGQQETQKYPPASLTKFETLPVANRVGQTTIYRVPPPRESQ